MGYYKRGAKPTYGYVNTQDTENVFFLLGETNDKRTKF